MGILGHWLSCPLLSILHINSPVLSELSLMDIMSLLYSVSEILKLTSGHTCIFAGSQYLCVYTHKLKLFELIGYKLKIAERIVECSSKEASQDTTFHIAGS